MITYVLDNNIFSHSFNNLSFDVFDDIWVPWQTYLDNGRIISVDEVYHELYVRYGDKKEKGKWLKKYKASFLKPTNSEGKIVADIYASKKFREGIKERSLREGSPEADALLVAKAKAICGVVVTAEADDKPNSEKIPNICSTLKVPYIKKDDFYKVLKNVHTKRNEWDNVCIQYELAKPVPINEAEFCKWVGINTSI